VKEIDRLWLESFLRHAQQRELAMADDPQSAAAWKHIVNQTRERLERADAPLTESEKEDDRGFSGHQDR